MKVVYIAGPFSGTDHWKVARNVMEARRWVYWIAERGGVPLCPHSMYEQFDGTLGEQFWLDGTMELLTRCDAIAMVPGWQISGGSKAEFQHAVDVGMPRYHFGAEQSMRDLEAWLRGNT